MKQSLISIILSTYNWSKYIKESIESVLNQTYSNFEFIIINDCSTDNVEQIILDYREKDNRIIYIKNEQNLKLTASLNKWLQLAKWKYIARIDDDDLWIKNKLEKQVNFMKKNPDYWLCATSFQVVDKEEIKNIQINTSNNIIKKDILRQNKIWHSTVMYKRIINNKLVQYDKNWNLVEDYELWLRIWLTEKLHILPFILTKYRLNNWLSLNNKLEQLKLSIKVIKKYKNYYDNFYISLIFRKVLYYIIFITLKLNIYKQVSYFYRKLF